MDEVVGQRCSECGEPEPDVRLREPLPPDVGAMWLCQNCWDNYAGQWAIDQSERKTRQQPRIWPGFHEYD